MKLFKTAVPRLQRIVLEIVLVILCVVLTCRSENFATIGNALNILSNVSIMGIIALGMTIVIIAGEIDLSVGSAAAWSACLMAWIAQYLSGRNVNMALALTLGIAAAIGSGLIVGMITGWLRVRFRVPTFITTLAWFSALRSGAQLITNGSSIVLPESFGYLGSGYVFKPAWFHFLLGGHTAQVAQTFPGVPVPAVIFLLMFVLTYFLMNHTPFGRSVYAVGGNAEAARLSGIRVHRVKIIAMAIVAVMAAIAGIIQASRQLSGSPDASTGMELDVIAAVIIGGTSLMGGSGKVWGTLIGLLFLGVLASGMNLLGTDTNWQGVVRGALILSAVLLNSQAAKRS